MNQVNFPSEKNIFLKTAQNGNDFVGIKITREEREIIFPMGYVLPREKFLCTKNEKVEKQIRKKIVNLIKCIFNFTDKKKGERISTINGRKANDFPVKAMLFVIEDFLDRGGYYTEKEVLYTKNAVGKINWIRTIKNIKPIVMETGVAFLDFIIRKNRIQENQLITEIHKFCVYKSFELLGFLYTPTLPEKGVLQESDIIKSRKHFAYFLQGKIDGTHLEKSAELFGSLLEIINNCDSESEIKEASCGTLCFQIVWEKLVEKMFSTVSKSEKEKYFYSASRWTFTDGMKRKNAPLRPDTIMILERKCFVVDSKYYSYDSLRGIDDSKENCEEIAVESVSSRGTIPGTDSIQKQITYAQYLDCDVKNFDAEKRGQFRFSHGDIYNVFVLPANNGNEPIAYIGSAKSDWHDGSKNYHTVHAVTLDTQWAMENAGKSNESFRKRLADVVKNHSQIL